VECGIDPGFFPQPAHLLVRAGTSDDAAALDLRDLADDGADGTGGSRDEDGFVFLGAADVEKADVGGHPRHAESSQKGLEWREVRIDLRQIGAVGDVILPPAAKSEDGVAHLEGGAVRLHYLAHTAAVQRRAERNRRAVAR